MSIGNKVFITELEKNIVWLYHQGTSFKNIANEYNLTLDKVEEIYNRTIEDINTLMPLVELRTEQDLIYDSIPELLNRIGIDSKVKGREEMEEAIKLAIESPKLLKKITEEFYPRLAIKMEKKESLVISNLRYAMRTVYEKRKETDGDLFLKHANIRFKSHMQIHKFLIAAIKSLR